MRVSGWWLLAILVGGFILAAVVRATSRRRFPDAEPKREGAGSFVYYVPLRLVARSPLAQSRWSARVFARKTRPSPIIQQLVIVV